MLVERSWPSLGLQDVYFVEYTIAYDHIMPNALDIIRTRKLNGIEPS